jgi:hypothetical protein
MEITQADLAELISLIWSNTWPFIMVLIFFSVKPAVKGIKGVVELVKEKRFAATPEGKLQPILKDLTPT